MLHMIFIPHLNHNRGVPIRWNLEIQKMQNVLAKSLKMPKASRFSVFRCHMTGNIGKYKSDTACWMQKFVRILNMCPYTPSPY